MGAQPRRSLWAALGVAALCALLPLSAQAAPRKKAPAASGKARVAVVPGDAKSIPAAKGVSKALAKTMKLIGVKELGTLSPMPSVPDEYATASAQLGATAFIVVETGKGKKPDVTVTVFNGRDGRSLGMVKWKAPPAAGPRSVEKTALKRLKPLLAKAKAPASARAQEPVATPEPMAEPAAPTPVTEEPSSAETAPTAMSETPERSSQDGDEDEDEEDEAPRRGGKKPLLLDAEIGGQGYSRRLNFTDDLFNAISGYRVRVAPAIVGGFEYYPGAHFGSGLASQFGLIFAGDYTVGLSSVTEEGEKLTTSASGFSGGVKFRYPLSMGEVGASLAYGVRSFSVGAPESGAALPLPNVSYQYAKVGLSGRAEFTRTFSLRLGLGFLGVLGTGELETNYFPHLSGNGVEGSLSLAYRLTDVLELRVGGSAQRFFFAMNPEPDDTFIAGGALDQYLAATLGVGIRLD